MRRPKYPLPRRYWLYAALSVALAALLFVNVFVFDRWTGERELRAYERADWLRAGAFLLAEAALFLLTLLFAQKGGGSSFAAIPGKMRNTRSSFVSRASGPGNTPACGLISRVDEGRWSPNARGHIACASRNLRRGRKNGAPFRA